MRIMNSYDLIDVGDKMNDHIEGIFNSMLEDIKTIKLSTYFRSIRR